MPPEHVLKNLRASFFSMPLPKPRHSLRNCLVQGRCRPRRPKMPCILLLPATNGVDYLVTWNFRHIANATLRSRIEHVCRRAGYAPPVICAPNELLEFDHGNDST